MIGDPKIDLLMARVKQQLDRMDLASMPPTTVQDPCNLVPNDRDWSQTINVHLHLSPRHEVSAAISSADYMGYLLLDMSAFLCGGWPMTPAVKTIFYLDHRNGRGYVEYAYVDSGLFWIVGGYHPLSQRDLAIAQIKRSVRVTDEAQREIGRGFLAQYIASTSKVIHA